MQSAQRTKAAGCSDNLSPNYSADAVVDGGSCAYLLSSIAERSASTRLNSCDSSDTVAALASVTAIRGTVSIHASSHGVYGRPLFSLSQSLSLPLPDRAASSSLCLSLSLSPSLIARRAEKKLSSPHELGPRGWLLAFSGGHAGASDIRCNSCLFRWPGKHCMRARNVTSL